MSNRVIPKTVIVSMPDGERIPLLVEAQTGLPIFDAATYVLIKRRPNKAWGTIIGDLSGITMFMEWAARREIDLDERVRGLRSFSPAELSNLVQDLRRDRRADDPCQMVVNTKWRSRIDTVCAYLSYEFSSALYRISNQDTTYQVAKARTEETLNWLRSERPGGGSQPRMGLDPSLLYRLLEIVKPHSLHNPWQQSNRIRNYAIVLVLCCLGLRLGELLSLRLCDVATRGGTGHLDIRRRSPDPRDVRRLPPKPKTLGRRLPLLPAVSRAIDAYILGPRLATSGGRNSEYIFLAKDGSNLSPRAVQQMAQQLVARHPEFVGLCPHQLRNTNSDSIQQALRDSSLNDHQARDIHTYMGGWVPGSSQPTRYSKRWLTAQAEAISLAAQKEVLGD